jgi:hypothetical protein
MIKENLHRPKGRMKIKKYRSTWYSRLLSAKTMLLLNKFRTPIYESEWCNNLVMDNTNAGVRLIAQALAGSRSSIAITKGQLGTDNTTPTDTDTGVTGAQEVDLTYAEVSGAVATLEFFYSDADLANGTYNEFALFIGTLIFSRVLVSQPSGYSKSTTEDTQVTYQINCGN